MDRIRLVGGNELNGEIPISGAKNAALPLMIASLLTEEPLMLENVPRLADVKQLERILENHGVDIAVHGRRRGEDDGVGQRMTFHAADIVDTTAPYELVSKMRASFWVIGPLLARAHEARVSLPGGCAIGTRPVDLFLYGLKELGAEIEIDEGYVVAKAPKGGLVGARVIFPKVSVGATHTIMMAATLAARHHGDRERRPWSPRSPMSPSASSPWAPRSPASAPAPSPSRASTSCMAPPSRSSPTASRPAPLPWPRP